MRISVENQSRNFLKRCKTSSIRVLRKNEIKKSIRDYLSSEGVLFSPYDKVFVIKKSTESKDNAIKDNIYTILSLMGGIIGGDFPLYYYLEKKKTLTQFLLYKKSMNLTSYLGDNKSIKVVTKKSTVFRETEHIDFEGVKLEIETPLSYIVNNIKEESENKMFIELTLRQEIEAGDIQRALLNRMNFAGISRLAIFYKNHGYKGKYGTIKYAVEDAGKKLDRRSNKVKIITPIKLAKKKNTKSDLDSLI